MEFEFFKDISPFLTLSSNLRPLFDTVTKERKKGFPVPNRTKIKKVKGNEKKDQRDGIPCNNIRKLRMK